MSGDLAKLMTVREVADALRVSERTLARWRLDGTGPPFLRIGRVIRYPRADVAVWMAGQRRQREGR